MAPTPDGRPWWKRLFRREPPALRPEDLIVHEPPTEADIRRAKELAEKYHWDELMKRQ